MVQVVNSFSPGQGLGYAPTTGVLTNTVLTPAVSNLTWYVATTGSDSNDGSSGSPFATIQHAYNVASQYDWGTQYTPTIQIADGTYTVDGDVIGPLYNIGANLGVISGNNASPQNVVLQAQGPTSYAGFTISGEQANWHIDGVTFDNFYDVLNVQDFAYVTIGKIRFDDSSAGTTTVLFYPVIYSNIDASGADITIVQASIATFMEAYNFGFFVAFNPTVTMPASMAITYAFVYVSGYSWYQQYGATFTNIGSSTGPRIQAYDASEVIVQNNRTEIPGNTTGSVYTNSFIAAQRSSYQQLEVPTTGATVTIGTEKNLLILNPAGTLSTLTVNLPPAPYDAQQMRISTTQIITTLTVAATDGSSIVAAPATLAAGQAFVMAYDSNSTTWYAA